MRFANPYFVYIFLIILAVFVFYLWAGSSYRRGLERFAQKPLLAELLNTVSFRKKKLKAFILVSAIVLMFLAVLRPQWGFHWEEAKRKGLDILIALDTSKSMLTEDVLPNRLQRSKLAIKDLVKELKGDRMGLIAFAGSAFLQCPLTLDYGGFLLSLEDMGVDTIPRPGTSITSAIKEALKSYEGGQKKYKVLIIITDGEDHEGDALAAADLAAKDGISIFCIGIGTREGELVPVKDDRGQRVFLKDRQGNVVKSRLDEVTLQKIALSTGGAYAHATNVDFGLDSIYRERLSKMEKRELAGKMNKHYYERFQLPLSLGLVLLLLELFITEEK